MEVLVDRVNALYKKINLDEVEKLVFLETISDLRAAYCSFCNKILCRDPMGKVDAESVGKDEYKNRIFKCQICLSGKN